MNTHMAVRDAVLRDVGIGLLPTFQARPFVVSRELRPVLEGWGREAVPVHAIYPSTSFLTPKVRAFVDEAVAGFARLIGDRPRRAPLPNAGQRDRRRGS